ncbi:MAG: carboxylesterase [Gammaproteobacteria bacterium]|jgi:phospholipase/carboxylesterase
MNKNNLLECVEIKPQKPPVLTVIWLHGLGADGHDFAGIVPQLNLPDNLPIKFIFPHAPLRPITINNGYVMRGWYDIKDLSNLANEDEAGIRDSAEKIVALIEREQQLGMPSNKIILAGFSQGGAMALHIGLRYPKKLAGIIALSAYLPLHNLLPTEISKVNCDASIMMAHGTEDPLLPISFAIVSRDFLIKHGCQVEWHDYPMQHTVCAQEIDDISQWLQKNFY